MRIIMKPWLTYLAVLALPGLAEAQDWHSVEQILEERCVLCHSGDAAPFGLRLDTHANLMVGSERGAVVEPGSTGTSVLFQRIVGELEPRMPLDGPPFLSEDEIAVISDWIASGAPGPGSNETEVQTETSEVPRADGRIVYGEVARIFGQACIKCHSDNGLLDDPPEGLRLDSYESILTGGDRIVVIPGNSQASDIVRRIEGLAEPKMPFDGPPWLNADDVALIRDWIDGGALSSEGIAAPIPVGRRVRLRGLMTSQDEIDGAAFDVTGATRIDKRPSIGQPAEVRARVGDDGRLIAERLRAR